VIAAYVSFDGSQNPPKINNSYNVDNVIQTGKGRYTVNFSAPVRDVAEIEQKDGYLAVSSLSSYDHIQMLKNGNNIELIKVGVK